MSVKRKEKFDAKLVIALSLFVVLVVFIGGIWAYDSYKKGEAQGKSQVEIEKIEQFLVNEDAYISGDKNAKITVVEFFDPACSACVRISPIVAKIPEKYLNQVRVVYRSLAYHQGSDTILSLLEAAKEQGKFAEALLAFNSRYTSWFANNQVNAFVAWGVLEQSGTDIQRAKEFLDNNQAKVDDILRQNKDDATQLGINATPTFFVNGVKAEQKDIFTAIENEIEKVYKDNE
ncbi:MAG: thioredoxin domain-containing protein [Campylobacteraceae bacterium]|jgi:protein-disulfide isomerase|nr:thioredoxin domain-containing protein [Campylobacteraceae bacterium]